MDTLRPDGFAAAVVALKVGAAAKTRLRSLPDDLRRRLAWAMAVDTLHALTTAVDQVLVVGPAGELTDELAPVSGSLEILDEPGSGLNAALAYGSRRLRQQGAGVVLACVGDLPALRTGSLLRILMASVGLTRSFVADHSGVGTTMLIARDADLRPHFEGGSAAAHESSGARPLGPPRLTGVPDARQDVDTERDLGAAYRLGLGAATVEVLRRADRLRSLRSA